MGRGILLHSETICNYTLLGGASELKRGAGRDRVAGGGRGAMELSTAA